MDKTIHYDALWQDHAPAIAWGNIALFLGIIVGYGVAIGGALLGHLPYWLACLMCAYLAFASFSVAHEACHGSIIQMGAGPQWIADGIGWISTLPFLLLPYRLLQRMHERHHAYTNDPARDPDYFPSGQRWYQTLLRIYLVPFKYHWMALSPLRHNPHYRQTYVSSALYMLFTNTTVVLLLASGYGREVLFFAIIPAFISMFALVFFYDFLPHHPHKSLDRHHNSRVILGTVTKWLTLAQSYHLVHHLYPRVPWYRYEDLYHRIVPDLDAKQSPIESLYGASRPRLLQSEFAHTLNDQQNSVHASLTVTAVHRLCPDAVEVVLALPNNERLNYRAGQYVLVSKWLNQQQVSRAYSLCSAPHTGELRIAVREVSDGTLSRYINQTLKAGDELIVQGPYGEFQYPPLQDEPLQTESASPASDLVLFAAGSGITPMMAICEAALQQPNAPQIKLIYCNRTPERAMLLTRLQQLQKLYPKQLTLQLLFSQSIDQNSAPDTADTDSQRLTPEMIADVVKQQNSDSDYYICGPSDFNDMTQTALQQSGIQPQRIHSELFRSRITPAKGFTHAVHIFLNDGAQHTLKVAANQTILEVANDQGIELPQGCGSGSCGSCKMKIQQGDTQALPVGIAGLSQREQAAGYTLACQCRPDSALLLQEANP
ncbi:fatty acid desaturase [Bacterioplanoides sp.]|uniref:fatty acid desaturase n=1 Tax=Bacterioplanoides sp. TaxID=2066072 RepID=UPI003AFF8DCB